MDKRSAEQIVGKFREGNPAAPRSAFQIKAGQRGQYSVVGHEGKPQAFELHEPWEFLSMQVNEVAGKLMQQQQMIDQLGGMVQALLQRLPDPKEKIVIPGQIVMGRN